MKRKRSHTIRLTVLDEDEVTIVSREVSGNPGLDHLLQAAVLMTLKSLRDVGYEDEAPDTLPEDLEIPDHYREEDWT